MSSCAASKSTRTRHFRHLHFISSRDACLVNHFGVNPVDRGFALAATGARRSGSSGTLLTSVRCLQPLGTELSTARVRKAGRARAVAAAEWVGNLTDGLLVHAAGWEGGVLLPVELQALGGEGAFWLKHPEMTPPCWQKSERLKVSQGFMWAPRKPVRRGQHAASCKFSGR